MCTLRSASSQLSFSCCRHQLDFVFGVWCTMHVCYCTLSLFLYDKPDNAAQGLTLVIHYALLPIQ